MAYGIPKTNETHMRLRAIGDDGRATGSFDNSRPNRCTLTLHGSSNAAGINVSVAVATLFNALCVVEARLDEQQPLCIHTAGRDTDYDCFDIGETGEGFGLVDLAECFEDCTSIPVYSVYPKGYGYEPDELTDD